jgi:hypothetical protein
MVAYDDSADTFFYGGRTPSYVVARNGDIYYVEFDSRRNRYDVTSMTGDKFVLLPDEYEKFINVSQKNTGYHRPSKKQYEDDWHDKFGQKSKKIAYKDGRIVEKFEYDYEKDETRYREKFTKLLKQLSGNNEFTHAILKMWFLKGEEYKLALAGLEAFSSFGLAGEQISHGIDHFCQGNYRKFFELVENRDPEMMTYLKRYKRIAALPSNPIDLSEEKPVSIAPPVQNRRMDFSLMDDDYYEAKK